MYENLRWSLSDPPHLSPVPTSNQKMLLLYLDQSPCEPPCLSPRPTLTDESSILHFYGMPYIDLNIETIKCDSHTRNTIEASNFPQTSFVNTEIHSERMLGIKRFEIAY